MRVRFADGHIDRRLRLALRAPEDDVRRADRLGDELDLLRAQGAHVDHVRVADGDAPNAVGGLDEERLADLDVDVLQDVLVTARLGQVQPAGIVGPGLAARADEQQGRSEQPRQGVGSHDSHGGLPLEIGWKGPRPELPAAADWTRARSARS